MQIRFHHPEDFESLLDVFVDMSVHYNGTNAPPRDVIERNLRDRILGPDSDVRLVVAIEDGVVQGVAAISLLYPAPKERGQLFMKELYVHSDHRGSKVGEQLMRWIARHAIEQGCVRFDWSGPPEGADCSILAIPLPRPHRQTSLLACQPLHARGVAIGGLKRLGLAVALEAQDAVLAHASKLPLGIQILDADLIAARTCGVQLQIRAFRSDPTACPGLRGVGG
ncbi:GNAT family N-acetyltransferase [Roseateles sp. So40a]|uniref:GNAT family N-acetyltransferase n=1 Tax=Roseateles sp. So40a TaxID=3400226 RepID=UPI003A856EA7